MPAPTYGDYLGQKIDRRVLVVGDSNVVEPAAALLEACQHWPGGPPGQVVTCDFACVQPGIGLRDLPKLLDRLSDDAILTAWYDAVLVNLGLHDVMLEQDDWSGFFDGTRPVVGGMSYRMRIRALLDVLPDETPVYWIGVPLGLPYPPVNDQHVAAVNLAIACFDQAWESYLLANGWAADADDRVRYVNADAALGSISPRFMPDGVHYAPAAAKSLFEAVVALVLAG